MNKTMRYAFLSFACLTSFPTYSVTPVSRIIYGGVKAVGTGIAYVIASPFYALDILSGREQEFQHEQEAQRGQQGQQHAHMVIENRQADRGEGPAIIVTVNNNNQMSSQQPGSSTTKEMPTFYSSLSQKAGATFSWLRHNKLACLTILGVGSFVGLQAYLWYLARYLAKPERWVYWKQQCTVEELYQVGHESILKELVQESCRRFHQDNPLVALEQFTQQVQHEHTLLVRYKKLAEATQRRYIKKLFFISQELVDAIDTHIQRILYLNSIASGWLQEQQELLTATLH